MSRLRIALALLVSALDPDDAAPGHAGSLPDERRAEPRRVRAQRLRRTTTIRSGCLERSST